MRVKRPPVPPGFAVTYEGELVPANSPTHQAKSNPAAPAVEKPVTEPELPPRLLEMPDVLQETDYTCGPATMRAVLAFLQRRQVSEKQLARLMKTNSDVGTDPYDLCNAARQLGLWAETREQMGIDDLDDCVREGVAVIVLFQAWKDPQRPEAYQEDWADGHYSAVIGVDRDNVYLEDPWVLGRIETIPRDEFMQRWHGTRNDDAAVYQLGVLVANQAPDDSD
jgi:predicted double-glycine peptidase